MQTIAIPQKIEFKKEKNSNQGQVIIEPCYPGYGTTLGSSMRRVLLSSLPGAAVVGVKIKGADHEFMALPHIKEDVLEIILNLKQLCLKVYSDEIIKLTLDVYGEKEIKASDIDKNSQVEIVNPALTLAHITDMAGNLNMEIFVRTGRGYEIIENRDRSEKHEIGYIEMDSIFSPIMSVGIEVENMRVGKMTNWERLILNIATDGTITPEDAFKDAIKILIGQFSSLISEKGEKEELAEEIKEEEKKTVQEEVAGAAIEEVPKKKRGRPKKNE
jgi:DNA-directed RNA polymerase subunit alpha